MISDKQLTALAVFALGFLIATIAVYTHEPTQAESFTKGMLLIQGLDLDHVQAIEMRKGEEKTTLRRQDDEYVVESLAGYPAATQEVNLALTRLLETRAETRLGSGNEALEHFGLAEGKATGGTVRLLDEEGALLVGVSVGNTEKMGNAVRRLDSGTTYATEKELELQAAPLAYVDTTLFDLSLNAVRYFEITPTSSEEASFKLTVSKAPPTKPGSPPAKPEVTLSPLPEGMTPKNAALQNLALALRSIRFTGVRPLREITDISWKRDLLIRQKAKAYRLRLGLSGKDWICQVACDGPSNTALQASAGQIRSGEDEQSIERTDTLFVARQKAEAFTTRHAAWAYTLSPATVNALLTDPKTLLEDPNNPSQIAARHILIGFKGADGSDQTRNEEEARALAEEILSKARAEDADFAALAKEYSEGPSAAQGGDLGTFDKGKMVKPFEEAAWRLKPGEISDIVQTPFGFHIIQRTK